MNLSMWTAIREYVIAESRLAVAMNERLRHESDGLYLEAWDHEIKRLREQSTLMETAVREYIEQPL